MIEDGEYIVAELLRKQLRYLLNGTLEPFSPESKMFYILKEDFANYVMYVWLKQKIPNYQCTCYKEAIETFYQSLILDGNMDTMLEEINAYTTAWFGMWKKRVAIVSDTPKSAIQTSTNNEQISNITPVSINQPRPSLIAYKEAAIETLMLHGDICHTEILSNFIVNLESRNLKNIPDTPKEILEFAQSVIIRAKSMNSVQGALVFISIKEMKYLGW